MLIFHLNKGFSKLLICGGYPTHYKDTCEVINLESTTTTCKNPPNFPAKLEGAIGGIGFKGKAIICGGDQNGAYTNRCYSLENNEWVSSVSMNSARAYASAAQLQDGKILVTGGSTGGLAFSNSAEMLVEEEWESTIPSLPVTIGDHCMVTVNSTTVIAIGGFQNGQRSGKTFFFTFGEESWTEGPELKSKRACHSCGRIRRAEGSQEMSIIVAGGLAENVLSFVEILDEGSNEWQSGKRLPFGISWSQMIEDQNGGVVLVGGQSLSNPYHDSIYQLPHGGQDAVWTEMEQKLKTGKSHHTAFLVPDNLVECF